MNVQIMWGQKDALPILKEVWNSRSGGRAFFFHSKSATPQLEELRANQPFVSHTDTEMSVNSVWHGSLLSLLALITMGFEVVDWYNYQSVDEVGGCFPTRYTVCS